MSEGREEGPTFMPPQSSKYFHQTAQSMLAAVLSKPSAESCVPSSVSRRGGRHRCRVAREAWGGLGRLARGGKSTCSAYAKSWLVSGRWKIE